MVQWEPVSNTQRDPNVYCDDCGAVVRPDAPDGTRAPCVACGGTTQQVRILIEDTMTLHDEVRIAVRDGEPGSVAPHLRVRTGDSWSARLRRWLHRTMRIDRTTTPMRRPRLIHRLARSCITTAGPLSAHRGHGDARRTRHP